MGDLYSSDTLVDAKWLAHFIAIVLPQRSPNPIVSLKHLLLLSHTLFIELPKICGRCE